MVSLKSWSFLHLIWLLSVLLLGGHVVNADDTDSESPAVPLLTESNFDEHINGHEFTLVKFMAPWCGHCKKLAPEYAKAAQTLSQANSEVTLVEVDATQEQNLAKKHQIKGFPTMLFFRKGKTEPQPYNGGRSSDSIVNWVTRMTNDAVEWGKTHEDARAAAKDATIVFYAVVKSKDSEEAKIVASIADELRMKGMYYARADPSVSESTMTVIRPNEPELSTKIDSDKKLKAWIEAESVPLFGPVGGENYAVYSERSQNWFWMCGDEQQYEKSGETIRALSKNYRSHFNFVWLDLKTLKNHCEAALSLTEYPSVAITYNGKLHHNKDDLTEKDLTKWVEAVLAGKAEQYFKSEPEPETNDEPVRVIVGSSFEKEIVNQNHDTFLEIYAPWCGHCKKLVPVWDKLAKATAEDKSIMIAKLDGTANEIRPEGFSFQGFPTLYYVKANTDQAIPYEGGRTYDDLVEFVKKQNNKIKFTKVEGESDDAEGTGKEEL